MPTAIREPPLGAWRRRPAPGRGLLLAAAAAAALGASTVGCALSWPGQPSARVQRGLPVQLDEEDEKDEKEQKEEKVKAKPAKRDQVTPLREAMDQVDTLRAELEGGKVMEKFGNRAEAIVEHMGNPFKVAVDRALYALYIRQLAVVRQELIAKFEKDRRPGTAVERADKQFVARAEELMRPGGEWSYEPERLALSAALEGLFSQDATIAQERERAGETQRVTADVIGKLQGQMEQMGEKLRGAGAGSPWVVWTSYNLPGTPFRVSGRYMQGRANVEVNLNPDQDPANAEGGFVAGLTPSNLGLSLNVGV